MRESIGRVLSVGAIGEFLPNAGTYVDLDQKNKDRFGLPLARIHSYLEPMDIKRLRFMAEKCRSILKAAGMRELVEEYGTADFFNTTHVFGTCRMGADPATSVVNSECRSHKWENLYICDASVFPSTGGGESPSLTIQALAVRAADAITAKK
jgi:choline dehydrogenase-like flavoprotein